jgi:hypothetical protein
MSKSIPDNEENVKLCTCPTCPTYKKSNLAGTLFCVRGKAKEPIMASDCICPLCPVFVNYGLKKTYYCAIGKASEV